MYYDFEYDSEFIENLIKEINYIENSNVTYNFENNKQSYIDVFIKHMYDIHLNDTYSETCQDKLTNNIDYNVTFSLQDMYVIPNLEYIIKDKTRIYPKKTIYYFTQDCPSQFVVTDYSFEEYKYKMFSEKPFNIMFPKKNTHILFEGNKYTKFTNIIEDIYLHEFIIKKEVKNENPLKILKINIWEKNIDIDTQIYSHQTNIILKEIKQNTVFRASIYRELYLDKKIINIEFWNNIFFENKDDFSLLSFIFSELNNYANITDYLEDGNHNILPLTLIMFDSNYCFKINYNEIPYLQKKYCKNLIQTYGKHSIQEVYKLVTNCMDESSLIKKNIIKNNLFQETICKWLVLIIDKNINKQGGWVRLSKINQSDISIYNILLEEFDNLLELFLEYYKSICNTINDTWNLNFLNLNIKNIFVNRFSNDTNILLEKQLNSIMSEEIKEKHVIYVTIFLLINKSIIYTQSTNIDIHISDEEIINPRIQLYNGDYVIYSNNTTPINISIEPNGIIYSITYCINFPEISL